MTTRTYTGWKIGLVIVAVTAVVFSILNVVARNIREGRDRSPSPVVTTVVPRASTAS